MLLRVPESFHPEGITHYIIVRHKTGYKIKVRPSLTTITIIGAMIMNIIIGNSDNNPDDLYYNLDNPQGFYVIILIILKVSNNLDNPQGFYIIILIFLMTFDNLDNPDDF